MIVKLYIKIDENSFMDSKTISDYKANYSGKLEIMEEQIKLLEDQFRETYSGKQHKLENSGKLYQRVKKELFSLQSVYEAVENLKFVLEEGGKAKPKTSLMLEGNLFTPETRSQSLIDSFNKAKPIPNLKILDTFRVDNKSTATQYSDPQFQRRHWIKKEIARQETVLKKMQERRKKKTVNIETEVVNAEGVTRKIYLPDGTVAFVNEKNQITTKDGKILSNELEGDRKSFSAPSMKPPPVLIDVKATEDKISKIRQTKVPPLPNEKDTSLERRQSGFSSPELEGYIDSRISTTPIEDEAEIDKEENVRGLEKLTGAEYKKDEESVFEENVEYSLEVPKIEEEEGFDLHEEKNGAVSPMVPPLPPPLFCIPRVKIISSITEKRKDITKPIYRPKDKINVGKPNLLEAIREGTKLNKVVEEKNEKANDNLGESIFLVMQRRLAIAGSDSEEDNTNDSEWE